MAIPLKNKLFINNEFVDAVSGKTFTTIDPATEEVIAQIAEGDKVDVDKAVAAARKAFHPDSEWRKLDASKRGHLMLKLASLIERDAAFLANLESRDNGRTHSETQSDMSCTVDLIKYYAGLCDKVTGDTIPADGDVLTMTVKQPVGVCGQITTWNFPILMLFWKLGPALAAGCTVVLKPAEQTPLSALHVAGIAKEAGFPPGVINIVPGFGPTVGAALAEHPDIDLVAFTGSTLVGKKILEASAKSNLKRVSLQLGGKSPLIIFPDADLEKAVETAHGAIFNNHGQNCCAGSRTFVHESIYDAFVQKAAELAKRRVVGSPFEIETQQGPQISKEHQDRIIGYISSGIAEGAKVVAGGSKVNTKGFYVQPTVLANVTDNMKVAKEEIFGPVQCILKFSSVDEVIDRANASIYGLAAGVVTKNIDTALKVARRVKAGTFWVNTYDYVVPQAPFGGFKQSGFGRELGKDGIEPYLETKTITIALSS